MGAVAVGGHSGGFDAHVSGLEAGAARLAGESTVLDTTGSRAESAARQAAGGVLGGPLAGAVSSLGSALRTNTHELAQAVSSTGRDVRESARTYQDRDASAQQALKARAQAFEQGIEAFGRSIAGGLRPSTPLSARPITPGGDAPLSVPLPGFEGGGSSARP